MPTECLGPCRAFHSRFNLMAATRLSLFRMLARLSYPMTKEQNWKSNISKTQTLWGTRASSRSKSSTHQAISLQRQARPRQISKLIQASFQEVNSRADWLAPRTQQLESKTTSWFRWLSRTDLKSLKIPRYQSRSRLVSSFNLRAR